MPDQLQMGDFSLSNSRRSQAVLRIAGRPDFKGIIERDIEQSAPDPRSPSGASSGQTVFRPGRLAGLLRDVPRLS